MLNRFFKAVHKAGKGSDFERYFSSVALNAPYAPSADEAKRDYRSARPKF